MGYVSDQPIINAVLALIRDIDEFNFEVQASTSRLVEETFNFDEFSSKMWDIYKRQEAAIAIEFEEMKALIAPRPKKQPRPQEVHSGNSSNGQLARAPLTYAEKDMNLSIFRNSQKD